MMKSWRSLIQKIAGWRYRYQHQGFTWWGTNFRSQALGNSTHSSHFGQSGSRKHQTKLRDFVVIFALSIIALTSVVGYRFYNQPQLTVGKISPLTIKAPFSTEFEDTQTTLERRKEVQTGIIPILKQDEELNQEISHKLASYLKQIDGLRKTAAPFPFTASQILSLGSQKYIRLCSESEFKAVLASVMQNNLEKPPQGEILTARTPNKAVPQTMRDKQASPRIHSGDSALPKPSNLTLEKRPDFNLGLQKVATELETYSKNHSATQFDTLIAQITLTRYRYSQAWKGIPQGNVAHLDEKELIILLDLTEKEWKVTKKTILRTAERILIQGIPLGLPSNLLEQTVMAQLNPDIPDITEPIAYNLLLATLQPNLKEDRDATRNIAEKAAMAINSVVVEVEQGEVIVEQGEKITQTDFVLLDGFKLSQRGVNWRGIQLSTIVVGGIVSLFLMIQRRIYASIRHRDYLLLCLLAISAPILSILEFPYTSLPAIGLLVSSFYSPSLAICQVVLVTGLVMFSSQDLGSVHLLSGLVGGLITGVFAGRLRSREAISKLSIAVGLSQIFVYLIAHLILSASASTIWSAILPDATICGLFGVAWIVVAIGISPYLERFFDLITPIRLAELSNPNLPLLKRLATEAPGTFQHTMFVASLAEAAARALNCNVELVRAGTLYHDIGKMHDPL